MSIQEFVELIEDDVERHFPKGKSKSRGNAIALVAIIAQRLLEQGLLSDE